MKTEYTKVLDKGFVGLKDFMGGDMAVVEAARVSYGGASKGSEKDRKLIHYLYEHDHLTPFEHAVFKLHVKVPIFVTRQWHRHRAGAFNEISRRYTEAMKDDFYIPAKWSVQDKKNKQGSRAGNLPHRTLSRRLEAHGRASMEHYNALLEMGVAREEARMFLPVNLYTEFYWTVSARNLLHFIGLRSDGHAQSQMRAYSHAILDIFRQRMPWTFEAAWKRMSAEETLGRRDYHELFPIRTVSRGVN